MVDSLCIQQAPLYNGHWSHSCPLYGGSPLHHNPYLLIQLSYKEKNVYQISFNKFKFLKCEGLKMICSLIAEVISKNIHVSMEGENKDSCGSFAAPCKTMKYAIIQQSSNNDVIMVDGKNGNTEATFEDSEIPISNNITIKGFNGRPIIICRNSADVFKLQNASLYLQNIAIENKETKFTWNPPAAINAENSSVFIDRCHFQNVPVALKSICSTYCMHEIFDTNFIHPYQAIELKGIMGSSKVLLLRNRFVGNLSRSLRAVDVLDGQSKDKSLFSRTILVQSCHFSCFRSAMGFTSTKSLKVRIVKSQFLHNHETLQGNTYIYGAALYVDYNADSNRSHSAIIINDCVFTNNTNVKGGAIYLSGKAEFHILVKNCTFIGNVAMMKGGAIHAEGYNNMILSTSTFLDNICSCGMFVICSKLRLGSGPHGIGGAVSLETNLKGNLRTGKIHNCTFENNTADMIGGAIYSTQELILRDVYFESQRIPSKSPFEAVVMGSSRLAWFHNVTVRILHASNTQSAVSFRHNFLCAIMIDQQSQFICPKGSILTTNGFNPQNVERGYLMLRLFSFYCQICPPDYYTLDYSVLRNSTKTGMQCSQCPAGGLCRTGILRAKDNHWGYRDAKTNNISFIQLPRGYGCSSTECVTYNSCAMHRKGMLCGTCENGYSESVLSAHCIAEEKCHIARFWLVAAAMLFLFLMFFLYKREIIKAMKSQLRILQRPKFWDEHERYLKVTDDVPVSINDSFEGSQLSRAADETTSATIATGTIRATGASRTAGRKSENEEACIPRETRERCISQPIKHDDMVSNNEGSYDENTQNRRCTLQPKRHHHEVVEQEADEHLTVVAHENEELGNVLQFVEHNVECSQSHIRSEEESSDPNSQCSLLQEEESDVFSGFIKIMFYFYQVMKVLRAYSSDARSRVFQIVRHAVSGFFNFEFSADQDGSFSCALIAVTPIIKVVLRLSFVGVVFTILIIIFITVKIFGKVRQICQREQNSSCKDDLDGKMKFKVRALLVLFEVILFSYAAITEALLALLTCVKVGGKQVLFIQGDIECYGPLQYGLMILGFCWVIPFCLFVFWLPGLLQQKEIGQNGVFLGCALPLPCLMYFAYLTVWGRGQPEPNTVEANTVTNGILKFLIGPFKSASKQQSRWEGVYLSRRLVLVSVNAIVQDQIYKLFVLLLIQVSFLSHHLYVKPFKAKSLNVLEAISLIAQITITTVNTFAVYDFAHGFHEQGAELSLLKIFGWVELVLVLLTPTLILLVVALLIIVRIVIIVFKVIRYVHHMVKGKLNI